MIHDDCSGTDCEHAEWHAIWEAMDYRPTADELVGAEAATDRIEAAAREVAQYDCRHTSKYAALKFVPDVRAQLLQVMTMHRVRIPEARLRWNWDEPLRHMTFYKAVYRPAVLRAEVLSPELKFHSLRHTYASLCVAAGIPPLEIARFMGHAKVTTTLTVYAHLFEDDHADAMDALGAMSKPHRQQRN